jgi:hypothetical protein
LVLSVTPVTDSKERILWGVSLASEADLPAFVRGTYAWLGLATGDFNFVHPGCSGIAAFPSMFGINIASTFLWLILLN